MPITYKQISKILKNEKVETITDAYKIQEIKKLVNHKTIPAIDLAIDFYFNNENYDIYFEVNEEVKKLNN